MAILCLTSSMTMLSVSSTGSDPHKSAARSARDLDPPRRLIARYCRADRGIDPLVLRTAAAIAARWRAAPACDRSPAFRARPSHCAVLLRPVSEPALLAVTAH